MNYNACKVLDNGSIITPRGKLLYPALLEPEIPRGEKDESRAKYNLTLLIPKSADIKPLLDAVKAVVDENLTAAQQKTTKVKKPFIKVSAEETPRVVAMIEAAGLNPDDFSCLIRMSTKFKPTVVGPDAKTAIKDESEIYGGRYARVEMNFFFWTHPTGGTGISAGLNHVQLLENDTPFERVGGGAASFEAVDVQGGQSAEDVFG